MVWKGAVIIQYLSDSCLLQYFERLDSLILCGFYCASLKSAVSGYGFGVLACVFVV